MTGSYYLLNALWIGAVICMMCVLTPLAWRLMCKAWPIVRFIIVMCLPFGLVAGSQVARDVIKAIKNMKHDKT